MNTIGQFTTFTPAEKVNPYDAVMKEFVKASDKDPNTAWVVELDAANETAERLLIAKAAHNVDRTARLRERDDSKRKVVGEREKTGNPIYSGNVTLTFTLTHKHAQRRGK